MEIEKKMKTSRFHWFTCKAQVLRMTGNGVEKEVTESYLIDAANFTDAERQVTQLFVDDGLHDCEIKRFTKSNYVGVIVYDEDAEKYYKVKVISKSINENDSVSTTNHFFIVKSEELAGATTAVQLELKDWMLDTEIVSVTITDIVEIMTDNKEVDREQ